MKSNMIFVFGSNLAGRHGKGAAKFAKEFYGAEYGIGIGRTGMSYAIPTKGYNLEQLSLDEIERSVVKFFDYAMFNGSLTFILTPIGTGLAGHSKKDIWKILCDNDMPENVFLSSTWVTDL